MAVELGTAADTATLARAASGQPRDSPGRCPIIQNAAPEPSLGVRIEAAGSLLARTAYLSAAHGRGKRGAHAEWLTLDGTSSSAEASISTRTKPFPPEPSPIVIS